MKEFAKVTGVVVTFLGAVFVVGLGTPANQVNAIHVAPEVSAVALVNSGGSFSLLGD